MCWPLGHTGDVADVRAALTAHTRTLNALRKTQLEQGQRITNLETRMSSLEAKMDAGFAMIEDKFVMVNTAITAIADMLRNNSDEPGESS